MAESRKTTPVNSPPLQQIPEYQAAELCPLGLLLSTDRNVAWCNARFASQFGYSREGLIGRSLAGLYPSLGEFHRIGERGLRVMLQSGVYQDERLMRRSDGSLQWFRVHGKASDRGHPFQHAAWTFEALSGALDATRLTTREREVLAAMAHGLTAKECAKQLDISPRTVEKIRGALRQKYGVQNAAELIAKVSGLAAPSALDALVPSGAMPPAASRLD